MEIKWLEWFHRANSSQGATGNLDLWVPVHCSSYFMCLRAAAVTEMKCFLCMLMADWAKNKKFEVIRIRECIKWLFLFWRVLFVICFVVSTHFSPEWLTHSQPSFFITSGRHLGWAIKPALLLWRVGCGGNLQGLCEYLKFCQWLTHEYIF